MAYPSTDLQRSRQFYERVLGLTPNAPVADGARWVEYDIGSGTLGVGQSSAWPPSPDGPSAALEVEDFAAAVAALQAHQVAFLTGPLETPVCRMATFRDPDGNRLTIHRRKEG